MSVATRPNSATWWTPLAGTALICGVALAATMPPAGPAARGEDGQSTQAADDVTGDRSPVDLVITASGRWLVTANQTSNSASLVDLKSGTLVDELACGRRPTAVVALPARDEVLLSCAYEGIVEHLRIVEGKLQRVAAIDVGYEPAGVAVTSDGARAFVALSAKDAVAEVDLAQQRVLREIAVGRWPRYLALSPDDARLAVGISGDGGVAVVDANRGEKLFQETFVGMNLGHMQCSADGQHVYFPWITYLSNPITEFNIRRGWVLASRIARVRLDEHARREAISLDPPGRAVSDPHGMALSPDESWLVATGSGTHELLVYRSEALPWIDYGGPGDHLALELRDAPDRFYRVELGGRPMGVRFAADGRHVWVANYLLNCVQEVDLDARAVSGSVNLGGADEPTLARRGEAIFYDGQRSLDQWYSCHSCHYDGGPNTPTVDTRNDGQFGGTFKTIKGLYHVAETEPWTWHGWQTDLHAAVRKSLSDTLLTLDTPRRADVRALAAYLGTLEAPPNWQRRERGALSDAARRGEQLFHSDEAGCAACHNGPYFTDGQVHDLGLGADNDAYEGYNTPGLIGVARQVRWLHDGRCRSLEEVLSGPHRPTQAGGTRDLTPEEIADVITYLETL